MFFHLCSDLLRAVLTLIHGVMKNAGRVNGTPACDEFLKLFQKINEKLKKIIPIHVMDFTYWDIVARA